MNVTLPIHHHALQFPRKPAVIASSDTFSYARLDDLIWRGMGYFAEQGLKPGDRVGLVVPDPLLHLLAALSLIHEVLDRIVDAGQARQVVRDFENAPDRRYLTSSSDGRYMARQA